MAHNRPLNGWQLTVNAFFLGPVYLYLYLRDSRRHYSFAKYLFWIPLLLLLVFSGLAFSLSHNPYLIRFIYLFLLLVTTASLFFSCWIIDSGSAARERRPHIGMNLSRALAWMVFMGMLFPGLANIAQIAYFWLLGEYITVTFSGQTDIFVAWLPIGCLCGFIYGLFDGNTFMDRDIRSLLRSTLLLFFLIALFSLFALVLIVYPVQRLAPISYSRQVPDYIFYSMVFITIPVFIVYFMKRAASGGLIKAITTMPIAIFLVILHAVVLSGYTVTIDLTVASILEDDHRLESAQKLYGKCIPYIKHDNLLAALHHRQGVLNVMNRDYDGALQAFKKVMADYSDNYEVYQKAKRYVASYDKDSAGSTSGRRLLHVRHQTFEQAASCFPNSLSVILNFYEEDPVSTRQLSYSIKEGFSQGTFIWKAESFLEKNGYRLITTFWQDQVTLISLLNAGYPVLVYIPGHVYTLYGYDARMEMFFTYDTAKSNRWNDNPFQNLSKTWMNSSFLMSVVVKKEEEKAFKTAFPGLTRYTSSHQLWQKVQLSRYYKQKTSYWHDFDPYLLSESLGPDRLKIDDPYFLNAALPPLAWDPDQWDVDMMPVWQQPWAINWDLFEHHLLYLLSHLEIDQAQRLIRIYQPHFKDEYRQAYAPFFELQLAVALAAGDSELVASLSDNLIGITQSNRPTSHWGHYFKATSLIEKGDIKGAIQLLLPVIDSIDLDSSGDGEDLQAMLALFDTIARLHPALLDSESMNLLQIARVHLATAD